MWQNAHRLGYLATVCWMLYAAASPTTLACGIVTISVVLTFAMVIDLAIIEPSYKIGLSNVDWQVIRRMFIPSVLFNAFPLATSIRNQGVMLAIGHVLASEFVVTFNSLRTLTNSIAQLVSLTIHTIRPELTIAFGDNNHSRMRILHRRLCQVSLLASTAAAALLFGVGKVVFEYWTSGKVVFAPNAFTFLLLSVIANAFWLSSSSTLLATNKHSRLAIGYLCVSILTVAVAAFVVATAGLTGATATLLAADLLMICFVLPQSLRLTKDGLGSFVSSLALIGRLDLKDA